MEHPLSERDLLVIEGRSFDPIALAKALSRLGLEAFIVNRFELIESELRELVLEHGVGYVWRLVRREEAVLPPGPDAARPALLKLVDELLRRLNARESLTVVDPYLLNSRGVPTYLADLLSLLEPAAANVRELRLITLQGIDHNLFADLKSSLASNFPNCLVKHAVTARYHDRLWIADEARGLFVGASLNGIGRRYAIADYLESVDVQEIVCDLRTHGLL